MNRHRSTAIILVFVVLLAGCSGIGGSNKQSSSTTSTTSAAASTSTSTTSSTTAQQSTSQSTSSQSTTTTQSSWSPPKPPNTPFQDKRKPGSSRIKSVTFTNKVKAKSGNGYSNFDVEVVANTTMKGVDPEPLVDGDPYFLVQINGKNVARENVRFQHDNGTYSVEIDEGAFQQFNSGTLHVTVYLLDKDHQHDDIYGKWTGTIQYSSK